jgi:hypothetical protein
LLLFFPKLLNDCDILSSEAANAIEIALSHRLGLNQLAADAETARPLP